MRTPGKFETVEVDAVSAGTPGADAGDGTTPGVKTAYKPAAIAVTPANQTRLPGCGLYQGRWDLRAMPVGYYGSRRFRRRGNGMVSRT